MIRFGTGTYNVRDSEGVQPQLVSKTTATPTSNTKTSTSNLKCTVFFLDDTEHEFEFHKNAIGEELLEKVFSHLDLIEKDFFGLQFVCILDVNSTGSQMRWLDSKKSIKRQMMCPPYHLFFRVKFYVSDPSKLIEEYTRYLVYLQLRKDILEGRLTCSESEAALLGSYAAQSEIGDYSAEEHDDNYLADFRVVPVQLPALNTKISQLHRHHHGLYPADAEFRFLDIAKNLQLYGFDLYEAKDGDDLDIVLGVNCNGISIFQNGLALNSFPWAIILKLSFKRKLFYVEMKEWDNGKQKDSLYIFNAVSPPNCKMLWKSCIEHHTFFRLIAPPSVPQKSIFHLGSRFRYSGRTEYQSVEEMRRRALADRNFSRHQSMNMSRPGRLPSGTTNPIDCQQPSSSLSTASHTSNSSAFSATSAGDYASKLTSRCQRFLPRGGPSALLHNNIFRRKMSQLNPMAALPTFLQNLLPRSTSTFKLSKELARPDYDENFGDDEWMPETPEVSAVSSHTENARSLCILPMLCCHFKKLFNKDAGKKNGTGKTM
uniref:Moesin/ezrin/radixin homolog 1 n=1 Tax=Panagrellus redivivus TaxID=6233 RepID=A0A7E4UVA5_PANRE